MIELVQVFAAIVLTNLRELWIGFVTLGAFLAKIGRDNGRSENSCEADTHKNDYFGANDGHYQNISIVLIKFVVSYSSRLS